MRKRTIQDKVITNIISVWYKISDFILLRYKRFWHEKSYKHIDENPLISIIIPTFDRGQLLIDRTLPSIFVQTYQNFEILIIGDCCVGETAHILKQIRSSKVKFINLRKRTNYPDDPTLRWFISGVAPLNHGLKIAKGKWICSFDDDDIMTPDYLESLLRFAQVEKYEFVAGLYEEEREGVISVRGMRTDELPEFGGHSTWLYRSYLKCFKYNVNSWRKPYNCPQDIDRQLRMISAGVNVSSLNKVVSYIRPRPGLNTIGLNARLQEKDEIN
jgi:glycosyltransferase involved in cell wall biosynthesis